MTNQAYVMHHIPGRMRIKLPHAKGNPALLERIKKSISPQSGVRRIEINPTTMDLHQSEPNEKVAASIEALRTEIAALRAELRRT